MAQVKFYRGLKANYLPETTHLNGLYFATDTEELLLNGQVYGNLSSLAVTAGESTDKIKLSYTTSTADANGHKTKTLSLDYTALTTFLTNGFIVGGNGIEVSYADATKWTITAKVDTNGYLTLGSAGLNINPNKIANGTPGETGDNAKLATKGYVDATAASAANGAFKGVTSSVELTKQDDTNTYSGTISFYDNAAGTGDAVKTVAVSFNASDFVKDGILDNVLFIGDKAAATAAGKTAPGSDYPYLLFTFVVGQDANKEDTWVSVKNLVDTYTAGNGLDLSNRAFSVKAKTNGGITVDGNGVSVAAGNGLQVDANGVSVKAKSNDYIAVDANGVALDSTKIKHGESTETGEGAYLVTKQYVDENAIAGLQWIDVPAPQVGD